MLSVKQGSIKYHFWVFGMTRPGIEPRSLGLLANTLIIMPISSKWNTPLLPYWPDCLVFSTSLYFRSHPIPPFFSKLPRITWQFHLSIVVEVFQEVFSDTTQQLQRSSRCLGTLPHFDPSRSLPNSFCSVHELTYFICSHATMFLARIFS